VLILSGTTLAEVIFFFAATHKGNLWALVHAEGRFEGSRQEFENAGLEILDQGFKLVFGGLLDYGDVVEPS